MPGGRDHNAGVRHSDWGALSPRWAGIRSEETDVHGTAVHYLRADGRADGPTHLLVHPLAGSATLWLDVILPLARLGPVIAPDLPGTLFGHTDTRIPAPPGPSRTRASCGRSPPGSASTA